MEMALEKTLVLLKPDAIERRVIGRIIQRFEDADMKILHLQLVAPVSEDLISRHYRSTETWLAEVGNKTLKSYREKGLDVVEGFGTDNAVRIGEIVKERLIRYMTSAPVIAMVLEGNNVIKKVRSIAGYTIPSEAAPGTIRGDFSSDSPDLATAGGRSVENLVHASGNIDEATYEISLWFPDSTV
jgi:nucleoside-diphosphate kinase